MSEIEALDPDNATQKRTLEAMATALAAETGTTQADCLAILGRLRKRRGQTGRSPSDFYETPAWAIDAALALLPLSGEPVIVDAGAGTGAICARLAAVNTRAEIVGVEKDAALAEQCRARGLHNVQVLTQDFLKYEPDITPDIVIGNPPFSRSLEFVLHAMKIVKRGGRVAMLLRLGWLAGRVRGDFHRRHPSDVHVFERRPSFRADGKTDASEYAWFLWGQGLGGSWHLIGARNNAQKATRKVSSRKKPQASEAPR